MYFCKFSRRHSSLHQARRNETVGENEGEDEREDEEGMVREGRNWMTKRGQPGVPRVGPSMSALRRVSMR